MRQGDIIGGFRAEEYEGVEASRSAPYSSKALYHVVGMPGVWRRVSKPKVSDLVANGVLPCHFDGSTIYLKRDCAVNAELLQGGYADPPVDDFNAMVLRRLCLAEMEKVQPELPVADEDAVDPDLSHRLQENRPADELPPPGSGPSLDPFAASADDGPEM